MCGQWLLYWTAVVSLTSSIRRVHMLMSLLLPDKQLERGQKVMTIQILIM